MEHELIICEVRAAPLEIMLCKGYLASPEASFAILLINLNTYVLQATFMLSGAGLTVQSGRRAG